MEMAVYVVLLVVVALTLGIEIGSEIRINKHNTINAFLNLATNLRKGPDSHKSLQPTACVFENIVAI
jgi:hypothetical protein